MIEPRFAVGVSAVDITPADRVRLAGPHGRPWSDGVHDPLRAKTLAVTRGGTSMVLTVCDLFHVPGPVVNDVRRAAVRSFGVKGSQIAVCATHTHTGPEVDEAYSSFLIAALLRGIGEALERRRPTRLYAGRHLEADLPHNRRYGTRRGAIVSDPDKADPDVLDPVGPVDPEVCILEFRDNRERPAAIWVHYALPPDVAGGRLLSADYPHFLGEALRTEMGEEVAVFYTVGAGADVTHRDPDDPEPQRGMDEAARIGRKIAKGVLEARSHLDPAPPGPLASRLDVLTLAPFPSDEEDVRWAREELARKSEPSLDRVLAEKFVALEDEYGGMSLSAPVQSVAIGPLVGVTWVPGRLFAALALAVKRDSPFAHSLVVGLGNGDLSYLPPWTAYAEGGPEPAAARVAPGEADRVALRAMLQLRRLHESAHIFNGKVRARARRKEVLSS